MQPANNSSVADVTDGVVEAAAREALSLAPDAPFELSETARRMVRESVADEANEPRQVFTREEHQTFAALGATRELEIERDGEVDTLLDGWTRLVTVRSAYRRRRRLILEANPVQGPRPKIAGRRNSSTFKKENASA